jgi:O-methyltransferase involved in polyketide biosynthesis
MSAKIKIVLGDIQKTMLLPLWGRAEEINKKKPLLIDKTAVEIVSRIDYDFSKISGNVKKVSQLSWIARCINIDNAVRKYIK